jgi:hypothetical protein
MRSEGNGSGARRPHEIQAEIDRTRREVDATLHAIEQRLAPGQLYDQGVQYLRSNGGTEFFSNLGEQAKRNPMPVALVGIGLAWLMARGSGSGTEPGAASGRGSEFSAGSGPDLGERASQAKAKLGEMREGTRQQLDRAKSGLDTMMREQPLALGAVGLAVGALAAALAPRTAQEERLAGQIDEMANRPASSERGNEPARASGGNEPAQYPDLSVDPMKKARDEERERLQAGVRPYVDRNSAERNSAEPPV